MSPLCITAFTVTCAVGRGRGALESALRARRSGLRSNDFTGVPLATWIGRVEGLEEAALPAELGTWDCRNNRLAWLALAQDGFSERVAAARARYGGDRIAIVIGTSTSSIGATEEGYARVLPDGQYPPDLRRPIVHAPHSLGDFLQHSLGLDGPCMTVATACSSSAKVFAHAERLIRLGLADAALVGGTDSLCGSVLFGFHSLGLLSPEPCRPFDPARRGLSLGEAAGFALLERDGEGPWLLGHGESSDAHHMSSPHPQGQGARLAIEEALATAGLAAGELDYINLHGTASRLNDEIEGRLVAELFPAETHASSTKGWTGHALGAAGIVEAAVALIALETGLAPGTLNSTGLDPACGPQVRLGNAQRAIRIAGSHSFGFGGSNCVLVFGRERPPRRAGTAALVSRAASKGPHIVEIGSQGASTGWEAPAREVFVEGIALWAPRLPGWEIARPILRGEAPPPAVPAARPAPALLAPTERRRAPDSVALALEVAASACASSGRDASELASVFASTYGDIALSDSLCAQLASAPLDTSPTKFHNSVHNAAAGYWAIATGCRRPYTALTAHHHTFGAGLVTAAVQALTDEAPVLLAAYDIEARGPLATMAPSRGLLGAGLVLAPRPSTRTLARLSWRVSAAAPVATAARARNAALVEGNAMAGCLVLYEALAERVRRDIALTLANRLILRIEIEPAD